MTDSSRRRGLTLVEVIVAVTLTAMVAGSTVTILRSTAAARLRVDRQASLEQEARLAVRAITTALHNAYRTDGNDWGLEGLADSTNGPPAERIKFFTTSRMTLRPGRPESDVRECEFFLARMGDEKLPVLVRRMDPTRNPQPDGGGIVQRIAGNVIALDFQYNDSGVWRDTWPADYRVWPTAIGVTVAVADENNPAVTATAHALVGYTYPPVRPDQETTEQTESTGSNTQGGTTGGSGSSGASGGTGR